MTIFLLSLSSAIAWFISSLAGGGSPFIIMPMVNLLLVPQAVPPVVTIGMLFGNSQRALVMRSEIDWQLTWWYLPGAVVGAILGAVVYTQTQLQWLQVLLGLFLISSIFSMGLGKKEQSFKVQRWFFLPAGFVHAFISGLIGSVGPILNPFYLNYGLVKEKMIATKSIHVSVVHIAKIITYASLGALNIHHLGYGLVIGIAAIPGNWLGQIILKRISEQQFQKFVLALVTISGVFILWDQRSFFAFK